MGSNFLSAWYHGLDHISGLEAVHLLLTHQNPSRESLCRDLCTLVTATTGTLDLQRGTLPIRDGTA
jgi:hypothetical protein